MKRSLYIGVLMWTLAVQGAVAGPPPPTVFGTVQVSGVYRVILDRDALLLESIRDVIKQKNVQDGQVFVTAGSVKNCTFHYVTSTARNAYKTVEGPVEILNAGGIIADGEPHLLITLSSPDKGAFRGHLKMVAGYSISPKSRSLSTPVSV